jgi:hypothetical protein
MMRKLTKEQVVFFVELPDGRVKLKGWSAGLKKWCTVITTREIATQQVKEVREKWDEETQQYTID